MNSDIRGLLREALEEAINNQSFTVYHGSPTEIQTFSDEFVGGRDATDQEGPGIYFTTNHKEATGYAEGGYVYTVRITPRRLFDESNARNIKRSLMEKLVFLSSDWKSTGSDWSENPRVGIKMLIDSAYEHNDTEKDLLQQIWIEAYRYDGVNFVRNCVKVGIDGLIVNREAGIMFERNNDKHIIIYNPDIIEVTDVEKTGDLTEGTNDSSMTLDIMKNPEGAPYMGSRFGQDVEPKGTYALEMTSGADSRGWLTGKARINRPLMIDVDDMTLIQYKRDLAAEYKVKGANLTKKLMGKGYDALICRFPDGGFGEIVLFPNCSFTLS